MAKPPWFRHDNNARNDIKCLRLLAEHDWAGYGLWWAVVEILTESEDHRIDLNDLPVISRSLGVDAGFLNSVFESLVSFELLVKDGAFVYSESHLDRMDEWHKKAKRNKRNGAKGGRPPKDEKPPQAPKQAKKTHSKPTGFPDKTQWVSKNNPVATQSVAVQKPTGNPTLTDRLIDGLTELNDRIDGVDGNARAREQQHDDDFSFLSPEYEQTYGLQIREAVAEYREWPDKFVFRTIGRQIVGAETWVVERISKYGWPKVATALVVTQSTAEKPSLRYADKVLESLGQPRPTNGRTYEDPSHRPFGTDVDPDYDPEWLDKILEDE